MTGHGVLVIGYGNPLRTDDGIGWRAAQAVAADPRLAGVSVVSAHQLLPELAPDVSQANLVVLIDARVGAAPASLAVERVVPAATGRTTWSHHLDPAALAAMANELYGRVPPMFVVSVGVASLDAGERLSPALEAAVPGIVDALARLVGAQGPEPALMGTGDA